MKAKRILCPVDFSPCSEVALEHAMALAKSWQARLVLAHVDEPPPTFVVGYGGYASLPAYKAKADPRLEEIQVDPQVDVRRVHLVGTPGEVIVEHAIDEDCDLIVMGTHGRGGFSQLLFGSVAAFVLRHAKCPVIVLRDALSEHEKESATGAEVASK